MLSKLDNTVIQQRHRQEKLEALDKQRRKKGYAKLSKQICSAVYDVFPSIEEKCDLCSSNIPDEILEQIDDIKLVLRYFSTHPRILESLRTGILSDSTHTNV